MAILSNINGKFAVDSTGAVQFSGAAGTSGYILKSNGTGSAPTWVDPDTVVGPYLPLSGGTLTGATATASNIAFTVGGNLTVNGSSFLEDTDIVGGSAYPLQVTSTQRYMVQVRNLNNTVSSNYGWWWFMDTNFNMGFHADGASDRLTLTRDGDLSVGGFITTPAQERISVGTWDNSAFTGGNAQGFSVQGVTPGLFILETDQTNKKSYLAMSGGGMYLGGSIDFLGIDTDGARAVTIDDSQRVGIGTTSPSQKLHVEGLALIKNNTSGLLYLYDTSNSIYGDINGVGIVNAGNNLRLSTGGTERVRIDSSGNVGIGKTSPGQKLDVEGSIRLNSELQIFTGTTDIGQISNSGGALNIQGTSTRDVSLGSDSFPQAVFIEGSNGNVGIGTTSPSKKLDVLGTGLRLQDNSNYSSITIGASGWSQDYPYLRLDTFNSDGTGYFWALGHRKTDGTKTVRMLISDTSSRYVTVIDQLNVATFTSNELGGSGNYPSFSTNVVLRHSGNSYINGGNVGIGTTSPAYKLHISEAVDRSLSSSQAQMRIEGNGYGAFFALNTDSFQIGQNSNSRDLTFHSGASSANILERMRIKSHGDVVIGGTSTQNARTVSFDVGTNNIVFDNCTTSGAGNGTEFQTFRRNNGSSSVQIGSIVMNGTSGITYATSSDYRLKENVVELTNALDRVDQLKPSRFNFISDESRTIDGFLAHEVQDIVPEAIVGTKDEVDEDGNPKYQSIDQSKLVPLLVGAIQELEARVKELENK